MSMQQNKDMDNFSGGKMTTKEAYEIAVRRIEDIDIKIAELKGKREGYNEMRQVTYEMMCSMDDTAAGQEGRRDESI